MPFRMGCSRNAKGKLLASGTGCKCPNKPKSVAKDSCKTKSSTTVAVDSGKKKSGDTVGAKEALLRTARTYLT